MNTTSKQPRKQHKARATAPMHVKSKEMKAPLDRVKYGGTGVKRITIRKGDTVRVVRGSRTGHEGKISVVDPKKRRVAIEKALISKADNKETALWFDPSNLVVIKIDLSDVVRKERFKDLSDE